MRKMNVMEEVIKSIGMDGVAKYLPKGMKLHYCDMHGHYLAHYTNDNPLCNLCDHTVHSPVGTEVIGYGDGTTATEVEHYIDLRDAIAPPHNPHD